MSKRGVLLKALAATENDLQRMVRDLDETAVSRQPAPDQWRIADVLCHFHFVEERYLSRLQRVVNEERPLLPIIPPDTTNHHRAQPAALILFDFKQARGKTLSFLQGLKAGDWQRTAVHETWGEVTLRSLVQHLVAHDTNHLNQIIEIKQSMKIKD